ncbi:MAG: carbamoyl-phosphate synthase domain-containing protein, partial [Pseudomonadota bacterium]
MTGFLILEDGNVYEGQWHGDHDQVGEVVFNTSHNG